MNVRPLRAGDRNQGQRRHGGHYRFDDRPDLPGDFFGTVFGRLTAGKPDDFQRLVADLDGRAPGSVMRMGGFAGAIDRGAGVGDKADFGIESAPLS